MPRIREFADQPLQIRLAISLHGATDEVRGRIMPVNRKYPVAELMEACEYFANRKKQHITFEYILIKGVNDMPEQAYELARHARRFQAKINLIPYNSVEGLEWERPDVPTQEQFLGILHDRGALRPFAGKRGTILLRLAGSCGFRRSARNPLHPRGGWSKENPMADDDFDETPEVWDEYQWERFLQQQDRNTEKYFGLLEKYLDHPERDNIIAREMGWDSHDEDDDACWEEVSDEFCEEQDDEESEVSDEEFEEFSKSPIYQDTLKLHTWINTWLDRDGSLKDDPRPSGWLPARRFVERSSRLRFAATSIRNWA